MKKNWMALLLCLAMLLTGSALAETYTSVQQGFGGEVSVSITIEDGKMTDVSVVGEKETIGVGSIAIEKLPGQILEAQSVLVDAVTSATVTSTAILTGAKVFLMEKLPMTGGNAKSAAGNYMVAELPENGFQVSDVADTLDAALARWKENEAGQYATQLLTLTYGDERTPRGRGCGCEAESVTQRNFPSPTRAARAKRAARFCRFGRQKVNICPKKDKSRLFRDTAPGYNRVNLGGRGIRCEKAELSANSHLHDARDA